MPFRALSLPDHAARRIGLDLQRTTADLAYLAELPGHSARVGHLTNDCHENPIGSSSSRDHPGTGVGPRRNDMPPDSASLHRAL